MKRDTGELLTRSVCRASQKLIDKHVVGIEVKDPDGVYQVGKMGKIAQPEDWSEEKTRNETDIIKTRVTKMIEQRFSDDPYAPEAFVSCYVKSLKKPRKSLITR